ncbi:non-ribosomal peptide synthetase [Streptomyces calvus]|uniref:Non-ribosomal peptide synthetase n=1 Tax=Streptomyces calvus TaxID=67282 RepID=A0A514JYT0_9ACTN|nr:non-ribosomal peptide synthetase [Streptomyces calvus]QDI72567.1 non-ribosomal peptide synthetase [Streptomyces calvus]
MPAAQDDAQGAMDAPPAETEDVLVFPASFTQSRLWFMDRLAPGGAVYNVPLVIGLSGPLDAALLADCLTALARRHEVLRTTFAEGEDGPLQIVRPAPAVRLEVRDVTADEAERAAADEAARPFDLTTGPLLRALLLRTGPAEHLLVVTFHHTVCDGWSLGVFCRELGTLYQAHVLGLASPLPDLAIQYADYAVWQRERLESASLDGHLAHWRERLADAPALLTLPTDRPRPAVATHRGAEVPLSVSETAASKLRDLARAGRCTPFMLLLAAWQVTLARWSGQSDVCVGSPVAGRDRPELEPLIGYFANTVVLRARPAADMTFRGLLDRTRRTVLADLAHQDVPFERLVEELRPDRDLGHHPLFQAAFVLQNAEPARLHLPGLRCTVGEPAARTAKFDLTLALEDTGDGGFTGVLEYATDLFDAGTAASLAESFLLLLEHAVTEPDTALSDLRLVAEDHRADPVAPHPRARTGAPAGPAGPATLTGLFERQAARTPDATAVVAGTDRLSYAELDRRANRLARRLLRSGAGPDRLVALALPRSTELIVAILGVLKAGAAYLPVDPTAPAERVRHIMTDAAPSCVLTTAETAARLFPDGTTTVLLTDPAAPAPDDHTVTDRAAPATTTGAPPPGDHALTDAERGAAQHPDHLAYVIYTSGSTGRPKGVAVAHRQVVRLLTAAAEDFGFGADDTWSLFHSCAFDFSVWEIWGPLAHGGTLAVVPARVTRSPREFLGFLLTHRVTVLNQTPSAFRELTAEVMARPEPPHLALRTVVLGGEALAVDDLAPWFDRFGDRCPDMVNMYGITETTVHVTHRRIRRADVDGPVRSPVGHALADLRLHLLDAHGRPVPRGAAGELHVGGPGVARGYLHRPALTAERFVPDPFGPPGARLYRSGDLCRWRADGELEYLGRGDQQVKIRGFRIEPGEIEAALAEHPRVSRAAVLARTDPAGDPCLVGYVVPTAEEPPDAVSLRAHLGALLPSYMVPGAYVVVPALPLTGNGKLDRAALPAPTAAQRAAAAYEPPRGDSERLLAEMWSEVLGVPVERIGADDDFFDLGGHSFAALRLIGRMESTWDVTVPTATVFSAPTLRALAAWLDERPPAPAPSPLVPLRATGELPPLFLVHPVGGHVLCYASLAAALPPGRPVHALVARGMREGERPAARIEDMAADYLDAIAEAGHDGPLLLGGWSLGGVVAFEMARQAALRDGRTPPVVLIDSHAPGRYGPAGAARNEAELIADFAADWERSTGTRLAVPAATTAQECRTRLLDGARTAGLLDAEDGPAHLARLLDLYGANRAALERYRPDGPHHGRLLVLSAAGTGTDGDADRGWRHWTTGPVDVRPVPGDHYSLLREPNLTRIAAELRPFLDGSPT